MADDEKPDDTPGSEPAHRLSNSAKADPAEFAERRADELDSEPDSGPAVGADDAAHTTEQTPEQTQKLAQKLSPQQLPAGDPSGGNPSGSDDAGAGPLGRAAAALTGLAATTAQRNPIKFPADQKPVVKTPDLFDGGQSTDDFHIPPHMRSALEREAEQKAMAGAAAEKGGGFLRALRPGGDATRRKPRRARNKDNPYKDCQNCKTTLAGDYCHVCGQAAREPRRAIIGLVQDVFVETLAIDGKLFRTIALLFWQPGVLARRYLDGRRVHYSPPFRLYLFASVFFFFFLFWGLGSATFPTDMPGPAEIPADTADIAAEIDAAAALDPSGTIEARRDAIIAEVERANSPDRDRDIDGAGAATQNTDDETDAGDENPLETFRDMTWDEVDFNGPASVEVHAQRLFEAAQRVTEDQRLFMAQARETVPRTLLLAPLIYGVILTLLYVYRRRFFVYDHFIISLYMHAALYSYLLLAYGLSKVPGVGILAFVSLVWGGLQPLLVLRQAYGSPWISVIPKWIISNAIYMMSVLIIVMLGFSVSLYNS